MLYAVGVGDLEPPTRQQCLALRTSVKGSEGSVPEFAAPSNP